MEPEKILDDFGLRDELTIRLSHLSQICRVKAARTLALTLMEQP